MTQLNVDTQQTEAGGSTLAGTRWATRWAGSTRRRVTGVLALGTAMGALATLSAACGGPEATAPAAPAGGLKGTLRFMTRHTEVENAAREATIVAFKKKQPNVVIEGEGAQNMRQSLTAQGAAGDFPDVLAAWDFLFPYVRGGHVQALDDLVKRDRSYKLEAYNKEATDFYRDITPGNPLYALPAIVNSYCVFYNRDLFKQHNVKLPADGWTWDDYLAAAQKLTSGDGDSRVFGSANYTNSVSWWSAIWQNGADVLTPDRRKATIDQPAAVEALEWVANQVHRLQVHPTPAYLKDKQMNNNQLFLAGRIAMMPSYTNSTPGNLATAAFDWDVAPMPQRKKASTRLYSQGYAMGKASKSADAAWEFLKFLSSEESLLLHAQQGIQFPALTKLAESLTWVQPGKPPKTPKIMVDTLKYGRRDYFTHWTGTAESAMNQEIGAIWSGEAAPRAAARLAQEQMQAALDKALEDPLWK